MRVVFVRHGESEANAGLPSEDPSSIPLTRTGESQAADVAAAWTERPTLIVISPYRRTEQTAQPTRERFPDVMVDMWPIEEFTYLQPTRWNGTRREDRLEAINDYWTRADPEYRDGEGAESFAELMARVDAAMARLAALPPDSLVYVFGHGQFMKAVRSSVVDPELDDRARMEVIRGPLATEIKNTERLEFHWDGSRWSHVPTTRPLSHHES